MSYTGVGFIGWGSGSDYPDIKSGGKYISWWGEDWDDDEVYILRFQVSGLPSTPTSSSQVYPLLRAYVQSIPSGLRNQDVRGITVLPSGQTEIVFTDAGGIHYGKMDAGDMQRDMNAALSNMRTSTTTSRTNYRSGFSSRRCGSTPPTTPQGKATSRRGSPRRTWTSRGSGSTRARSRLSTC
jgi:hypothetical protein